MRPSPSVLVGSALIRGWSNWSTLVLTSNMRNAVFVHTSLTGLCHEKHEDTRGSMLQKRKTMTSAASCKHTSVKFLKIEFAVVESSNNHM